MLTAHFKLTHVYNHYCYQYVLHNLQEQTHCNCNSLQHFQLFANNCGSIFWCTVVEVDKNAYISEKYSEKGILFICVIGLNMVDYFSAAHYFAPIFSKVL